MPTSSTVDDILSDDIRPSLRAGNSTQPFCDGDEIFAALHDAIRKAQHRILFLTYIFEDDQEAHKFSALLAERARAGVDVYVLLDGFGAKAISRRDRRTLRKAGAVVKWFRPLEWSHPLNLFRRLHRKLMVVDGEVGFTGGIGISTEWLDGRGTPPWRDMQFALRGPIVGDLIDGFWESWRTGGNKMPNVPKIGDDYAAVGDQKMYCVRSRPELRVRPVEKLFRDLLMAAKNNVTIGTAYFNPTDSVVDQLRKAAKRGVDLKIIMPGRHVDNKVSQWAGSWCIEDLLKAGVRFFRYDPGMYHVKLMRVDQAITVIGSANLNHRSFLQDQELCIVVEDESLAADMDAVLADDQENATEITLELWQRRPFRRRLIEKLAYPFRAHG